MLKITVPKSEFYNDKTEEFVYVKETELCLEHSLVSLSKWESKWNKPFLTKTVKTVEETIDYVRCMTITQNVDPLVYYALTNDNFKQVNDYIESPMTATWFADSTNKSHQREIVTSEVIYYWMIALNIPFECQKWHLNRLLTLIRVCNEKNNPKKLSKNEQMARQRELNNARKRQMNTKG